MARRIALARPKSRTGVANSPGMLMSKSAVVHKAAPAANEGTLATGPAETNGIMTSLVVLVSRLTELLFMARRDGHSAGLAGIFRIQTATAIKPAPGWMVY